MEEGAPEKDVGVSEKTGARSSKSLCGIGWPAQYSPTLNGYHTTP